MYVGITRHIDMADKTITSTSIIIPHTINAVLSAIKEIAALVCHISLNIPVLFSASLHCTLS